MYLRLSKQRNGGAVEGERSGHSIRAGQPLGLIDKGTITTYTHIINIYLETIHSM